MKKWGEGVFCSCLGKKALRQTWLDLGLKCGHWAKVGHPLLSLFLCEFHSGTMGRKVVPSGSRTPRRGRFSVSAKTGEQASFAHFTAEGMKHADWAGLGPVLTSHEEYGPRVGEDSSQKKIQNMGEEMGTRQKQEMPNNQFALSQSSFSRADVIDTSRTWTWQGMDGKSELDSIF